MPHRFSEEELESARNTDLPDLLTSLGYQVRPVGRYHTTEEMDSLRIKNRRTWFRYSEGIGGDAITFLQHFHNKSFPEAMKYLLAWQGRPRGPPMFTEKQPAPVLTAKKTKFTLPSAHTDARRVFAYLRKRGIASQVIQGFLSAGLLYEDAKHHNCVFVGRDSSGAAVFANQRGTYDRDGAGYKGDVPGSDKGVAFCLPCRLGRDWVLVFEAPIDLMSYCTLHRTVNSNAIALCGLYDGPLRTYLENHPHLRRIILCLDNDRPGLEAAKKLAQDYQARGYKVKVTLPPRGKDWNESLCQQIRQRERRDREPL